MAGFGIAWASMMGIPYLLVVHKIPKERYGVYMGIINMMIVIPMLIQTTTFGYILKHFLDNDPGKAISFAGVLLLTACLSVFIALWGSLKERQQDLALLRMLGASAPKMAWIVLSESLVLALVASLIGLLLGQLMVVVAAKMLALEGSLLLAAFNWPIELWSIPIIAIVIALVAACVPAISVYRMNVLLVLQKRT